MTGSSALMPRCGSNAWIGILGEEGACAEETSLLCAKANLTDGSGCAASTSSMRTMSQPVKSCRYSAITWADGSVGKSRLLITIEEML